MLDQHRFQAIYTILWIEYECFVSRVPCEDRKKCIFFSENRSAFVRVIVTEA